LAISLSTSSLGLFHEGSRARTAAARSEPGGTQPCPSRRAAWSAAPPQRRPSVRRTAAARASRARTPGARRQGAASPAWDTMARTQSVSTGWGVLQKGRYHKKAAQEPWCRWGGVSSPLQLSGHRLRDEVGVRQLAQRGRARRRLLHRQRAPARTRHPALAKYTDAKVTNRDVRDFGWGRDRSRGDYATPADSPLHDGTPYRGLHVRRWGLGFVRHSRTILCRAVPNLALRFATFASLHSTKELSAAGGA
jgi:hypothetical protein